MMKVVGEEGTPTSDFVIYLKGELLDSVYLQQNTFDKVDGASSAERQQYCFGKVLQILNTGFEFDNKDEARRFFNQLRQLLIDWNYESFESDNFKNIEEKINQMLNRE